MSELAGDEGMDLDAVELGQAIDAALADLRALARTWPAVTDNDRLDQAFARLSADGIVARQDFACCSSCAHAEIWDEVTDPEAWRGYVWFHRQDTERAVAGDGLYLGYGARDEEPSGLRRLLGARAGGDARGGPVAIGREITQALLATGLPVTWNGKAETRILVDPFAWRRREPD